MTKIMVIALSVIILAPFWSTQAKGSEHPWATNTCAKKLFLKSKYDELLLPTTDRLNLMNERRLSSTTALRRFAGATGKGVDIDTIQAGFNPLDGMVREIDNAKAFLEYLQGEYPLNVSDFASVDCNANPAVALWASALQSYQDGEEKIVIPDDIRLLTLLEFIVQPVGPDKYQWADERMVALVSKMYLEAARKWGGDLSALYNPDSNFNRQGHAQYWSDLLAYLAIASHYDYEYALNYYKDLLQCKYGPITRWLWDVKYLENIHQRYPGVPNRPSLGKPALLLPRLASEYLSKNITELIDLSGNAMLSLGDQIYGCCTNAQESRLDVQAAAVSEIGVLAGWARGISDAMMPADNVSTQELELGTASIMPRPIDTVKDLYEAKGKWVYIFGQHNMLVELYRKQNKNEAYGSVWLREIRRRLPQWELIAKGGQRTVNDATTKDEYYPVER